MLKALRRYQKWIFSTVAVMVIASFSLFGAFSVFSSSDGETSGPPVAVGKYSVTTSEFQLVRALVSDGLSLSSGVFDSVFMLGLDPMVCGEALASLIEEAKTFRHYRHRRVQELSYESILKALQPEAAGLLEEFTATKNPEEARALYIDLYKAHVKDPWIRQWLCILAQRFGILQDVVNQEIALFGHHTAEDWFGKDAIDRAARIVIGVAFSHPQHLPSRAATRAALAAELQARDLTLASLGVDERSLVSAYRLVLGWKAYVNAQVDLVASNPVLKDQFRPWAATVLDVEEYTVPALYQFKSLEELAAFAEYERMAGSRGSTPWVSEAPGALFDTCALRWKELSEAEALATISLQETLAFEMSHWDTLARQMPFLRPCASDDEKVQFLEELSAGNRAELDLAAQRAMLAASDRVSQLLQAKPWSEDTVILQEGSVLPFAGQESAIRSWLAHPTGDATVTFDSGRHHYQIEIIGSRAQTSLPFSQAVTTGVLSKSVEQRVKGLKKKAVLLETFAKLFPEHAAQARRCAQLFGGDEVPSDSWAPLFWAEDLERAALEGNVAGLTCQTKAIHRSMGQDDLFELDVGAFSKVKRGSDGQLGFFRVVGVRQESEPLDLSKALQGILGAALRQECGKWIDYE